MSKNTAERREPSVNAKPANKVAEMPTLFQPKGGAYDTKTKMALLVIVFALLGTLFIRVDQVITAPGKVVPSTKIKTIQHLEGGIVKRLSVKEGDPVKEGDILVELDLATSGMNLDEITVRRGAMAVTRQRLLAEANATKLQYEAATKSAFSDLVATEMATYRARKAELDGILAVNEAQAESNRKKVSELEAKLAGARARQVSAEKELEITSQLVRERLVSQLEFLDKTRNLDGIKSEVASIRESIGSAIAAVNEREGKKAEEEGKFRRRAADELTTMERQLSSVREELGRATDQRERAVVRSPISGIVKNLKLQAVGNVVRQGEPMMEVVPNDEQLVVEARLSPSDRGFVSQSLKADVKVSAYDFLRYGTLPGTVSQIAVDTDTSDPQAGPFYKVVVATSRSFFGASAQDGQVISPGMTAEVDIHVGSQPFIWYLVKPVLKLKREAFREP
jgi:adhesin transport system membrane fusion protein